jgi:SAM-dependent methyltransferase
MEVVWNYTDLAEAYLKRPDYAEDAIKDMIKVANLKKDSLICDVGAGAAHLTLMMAKYGFSIYAVEPNDAMRANGIRRTSAYENIKWFEGVGEDTKMESKMFDLVTFGSSFNVCDRLAALAESSRILKEDGWVACMWNHRDLQDPLQMKIEEIIQENIPGYSYGTRREDQTDIINQSGLFQDVIYIEGNVLHEIPVEDFIDGWKSHGTLHRQSKEKFDDIIQQITDVVLAHSSKTVLVPYTTKVWMAQKAR